MDRAFTVKSEEGLLSSLATPCHISKFDPTVKSAERNDRNMFHAMWDTGASRSIITPRVVEALGLKPIRAIRPVALHGVDGLEKSEAYVVNIHLLDKITMREMIVLLKIPGDVWWDVIIGMDIISIGDFSVRNVNSKTEWTFGIPSQHHSDYDQEHRQDVSA